ncbi:dispanin family [Octopus vulgaris]|uniref:Dispanin family n=1 Tax=Octopus vulgaris TaxID=6645 RepID=A0AA36AME9_OCTVU|nr:dispanin family [Octopus vulgaris]
MKMLQVNLKSNHHGLQWNSSQRVKIIGVEQEKPDPVPNLMWASIIVTVCCNLPFGIIAIMYSSQANEYAAGGNTAAALKSNSKARVYIKIAIFLDANIIAATPVGKKQHKVARIAVFKLSSTYGLTGF